MLKKDLAVYPAVFDYATDGITVTYPDLPGCITCAQNQDEAVYMAKDALGVWLAGNEELGNTIPDPSDSRNIKLENNQCVMLVDVWLPIYREEKHAGSVKKNVTIPIWLNSLAEKRKLNFSQVLQAGLKASLGIQDR